MQRAVVTIILIGCFACVSSRHVRRSPDSDITGISIISGLCMNVRTDRLVYRYKNDTYAYIAFDTLKTGMVDVFSWAIANTPKGNFISSKMQQDRVLALDFRKTVNRDHVIGATGKRHQKQFKQRMERKMKHCHKLWKRKKKHCKLTSIHSVFVRLKMRYVNFVKDPEDCDT